MKKILSMFIMLLVVFSMFSVNVEASQVKYTKSLDNKFKSSLNKYNYLTFEQITKTDKDGAVINIKNLYTFNLKERIVEIISSTTSKVNDINIKYSFKITKNLDTGELQSEEISGLSKFGLSVDAFAEDIARHIEVGQYTTMYDVYKNFLHGSGLLERKGNSKGKKQTYKITVTLNDIKLISTTTLDVKNYKPVKITSNVPSVNVKSETSNFKFSVK